MDDLLNGLHTFPLIVQIAVWITIAVVGALVWLRGERAMPIPTRPRQTYPTEIYYDGPVVRALEILGTIRGLLIEQRTDLQRFADERNQKLDEQIGLLREQTVILRDIRDDGRRSRPRR